MTVLHDDDEFDDVDLRSPRERVLHLGWLALEQTLIHKFSWDRPAAAEATSLIFGLLFRAHPPMKEINNAAL